MSDSKTPMDMLRSVPLPRLIVLLVGLVLMVGAAALVFGIAKSPSKQLLFSNVASGDVPAILEVLEGNGVGYELVGQDTILVEPQHASRMRMLLAEKGLPRARVKGYGLIAQKDNIYGKTEMEQHVLYKQSIEEEIQESIETIRAVQHAKVLLAIPKSSRLIRNKGLVKASVAVTTYGGLVLTPEQVNGIVKIVSDSVPELHVDNITVVDQAGNVLNVVDGDDGVSSKQLEYVKSIEDEKEKKIIQLIEAFVGVGGVKAAVTAEVDFSHKEVRSDNYDSENPSIRSQQLMNSGAVPNGGVPGSFSNQPPAAGMAPEKQIAEATRAQAIGDSESVTNYELDKSSVYEVSSKGRLTKLTVSVVVAYKQVDDGNGGFIAQARTQAELERIEKIVSAAIGYSAPRGDQLFVSSEVFESDPINLEVSEESHSFWEQAWLGDAINQLLSILVVVIVLFILVKPSLSGMRQDKDLEQLHALALEQEKEQQDLENQKRAQQLKDADSPQAAFEHAKKAVDEVYRKDDKIGSQILKSWLATDSQEVNS